MLVFQRVMLCVLSCKLPLCLCWNHWKSFAKSRLERRRWWSCQLTFPLWSLNF